MVKIIREESILDRDDDLVQDRPGLSADFREGFCYALPRALAMWAVLILSIWLLVVLVKALI